MSIGYLVPYVVQVRHLLGMYLVITGHLLYLVPYLFTCYLPDA